MKKLVLMASAALMFGGIAYAQDTTMAPPAGATPDATQPATPDSGAMAPTGTATPDASGTQATTPDASGGMTTPPATDASGGMGMSGGTQPGTATGPNGPVSMTPTQGPTDLPACSKTVTDNCKQAGSSGTHHAMRHHKRK